MKWVAYFVECADGTLYAGATNDIEKRIRALNEGTNGARYTRSRRPVVLRYLESFDTKGEALSREAQFKKMNRAAKRALFEHDA